MIEFMLQFNPTAVLTVADVKVIAAHARTVAFDSFLKVGEQ